tara:strand:- start:286 stop:444 length:159 start_codon:yes stop_codon:yes gene_type:complete
VFFSCFHPEILIIERDESMIKKLVIAAAAIGLTFAVSGAAMRSCRRDLKSRN